MPPRLPTLLVALALLVTLAGAAVMTGSLPRPRGLTVPYAEVPRTDITAIELRKTGCFGKCPAFTARFTADGRATYTGEAFAPRTGAFVGMVDFEQLAAWIDSQHPETLETGYATNWVDTPSVTLVVERGTRRKAVTTTNESEIPLRFEGMILALDGAIERIRWVRDGDPASYLGAYAHGEMTLYLHGSARDGLRVFTRSNPCGANAPYPPAERVPGGLRLRCGTTSTTLRPVEEGLRAEGEALPPGLYRRITPREADRRAGLQPIPVPT